MERIENKMRELSSEDIIPVKNNRIFPFIIGISGIALFLLGIMKIIPSSGANSAIVLSGLTGICWGVIAGINAYNKEENRFIYQPSGKKFKKYNLYFNNNNMEKIEKCLKEKKFDSLSSICKEMNANRMLVVMVPDDGNIAVTQSFEYVPYNYEPVSDICILKGEHAEKIRDFCKKSKA